MSKFIEIGWRLFNADTIASIREGKTGVIVNFKNDTCEEFHEGKCYYDRIQEELEGLVIPAQPGFELINWSSEDCAEFWFSRHTIIAWRIYSYGVGPITAGNHEDAGNPKAILDPLGRVDIPNSAWFENLEDWEKYARREWEKHKAPSSFC